jgi:hypothetical protein
MMPPTTTAHQYLKKADQATKTMIKAENADIKMRRRAKTMVLATQSALQAF